MKKAIVLFITSFLLSQLKAQTFTYTYTYDDSGNRTKRVCVQVKSTDGESIFDSENQRLKESYVPSETLNDYLGETLITIYPNPTGGELVIRIIPLLEEASGTISIIGMDGRYYFMLSPLAEFNDLDLTELSNGNYILRLEFNGNITSYELIKE